MIELLIFHVHIVAVLYAFTKNWQKGNVKDGVLGVIIIGLIFTIGWALTSPISHFFMPDKWVSIYFNKDTLSLCMLFVPETIFFYLFFVKNRE